MRIDYPQDIMQFVTMLVAHVDKGAGVRSQEDLDTYLRLATEKLGEISAAITRGRWHLARYECIDLAHVAFLIWHNLHQQIIEEEDLKNEN